MNPLKTNYKNDLYTGKRIYKLTNIDTAAGTVNLDDVTKYQEVGDIYSAADINTTNIAVNEINVAVEKLNSGQILHIPASGWSNAAPYSQTILVPGSKVDDSPIVGLYISDPTAAVTVKNQTKSFGFLDKIVFGKGTATLYCSNRKPATDFSLMVKGV